MNILIYQMDVVFGEPQQNITKIEEMLELNDPEDGSLVILPELFLTGYHKDSIEDLTKPGNDKELNQLIEISKTYQITLFGSIPMRDGDYVYNTAVLIEKGRLLDTYKKSHLFGPMGEKELFSPGRDFGIIDTSFGTLGLSICYDLRFPELYKKQMEEEATLFLICAEWPIQRINHWVALLKARAIENQVTIIACNRVGNDPDYHYGGHSGIFDSFGEPIVSAFNDKEVVLKAEIANDNLTGFRNNFTTIEDRWIS